MVKNSKKSCVNLCPLIGPLFADVDPRDTLQANTRRRRPWRKGLFSPATVPSVVGSALGGNVLADARVPAPGLCFIFRCKHTGAAAGVRTLPAGIGGSANRSFF
jgi:hypothetical protein